jgi:hypothetical protein
MGGWIASIDRIEAVYASALLRPPAWLNRQVIAVAVAQTMKSIGLTDFAG